MKQKTYLFFDLDGTLTPSRQRIKAEMAHLLPSLGRTVIVVSGSKNPQIRKQIGDLEVYSLGQNGNQSFDLKGHLLWENNLSPEEKNLVYAHIDLLRPFLKHHIPDPEDLIEDRGSQISFSVYGHNASPEEKKSCDGNFEKRRALLSQCPFFSDTMEVQMGGSTCLDYFKKGFHKGANIQRLIETTGWDKEKCVYFGDALFPGGNDATVLGVIDTIQVRNEDDTYQRLRQHFLSLQH